VGLLADRTRRAAGRVLKPPVKVFKAIDVPGLDEITKAGVGAFLK